MDKEKNERIDRVPGTEYRIIQNVEKFSYGIDAVLLSEFIRPKGKMVDLGTGTGIIPIRLAGRKKVDKIYGIEIQKDMADMATRSVKLNKLEDKIEILNLDLREIDKKFKKASIGTVFSNPPYMKELDGLTNPKENLAISRHEIKCSLEDIIRTGDYLLPPLGRLYLVHRPDRLVDIFYLLRQYKLEPKYIQFIKPSLDKKTNLVLIEAVKHGKEELKFHKDIIIYGQDREYTEEVMEIYYKELK